jgi:hypothetical protein
VDASGLVGQHLPLRKVLAVGVGNALSGTASSRNPKPLTDCSIRWLLLASDF